jgi:serine/threonine-protein kinase
MSQNFSKNKVFGDWKLKKFLGGGGNGDVWLAVNSSNHEGAIKLLRKIDSKTYARFINEINIIKMNSDIEGVLPILDAHLANNLEKETPWYVMPVAQPLEKYLDGKPIEDIILAIREVAKTLFELHSRNISHRDIKPENLLYKDGKFYISDFGLVDYPNKIELTSSGDILGAKWTMAPEMRREGNKANGKLADIYSLAKTLWILITKIKKGFDGQYDSSGANGLKRLRLTENDEDKNYYIDDKYRPILFLKPIDDLLRSCTADTPSERPGADYFIETLTWWISSHKDSKVRNPIEWQELQKQLFPTTMPQRVIWEDINDIVYILNTIGSIRSLNHMFYPSGGGMDLEGVRFGIEPETIELIIGSKSIELIKPKRLVFENFSSDTLWNYFRLETNHLEPTGTGGVYRGSEELVEIEPMHYISRSYWDEGIYDGKPLPSNARLVSRYIEGDFVLFAKQSFYNHAPSTYDGRHNKMSTDEFRDYIAQKVKATQEILSDKELTKFAMEKEISINDVLINYFEKDFHKDFMLKFRDGSS